MSESPRQTFILGFHGVRYQVKDVSRAVAFYTEVLGFVTKREIPLGEHSWLTLVSPDDPDGTGPLPRPAPDCVPRRALRSSCTSAPRS